MAASRLAAAGVNDLLVGRESLLASAARSAGRLPRRRPTAIAELVLLAAWGGVVAVFAAQALADGREGAGPVWWCSAAGMRAMNTRAASGLGPVAAIGSALPTWTLMATAMMLPAALPAIAHVAVNSLCWRRGRAIGQFLAVYLAVWALYGALAYGLLARLGQAPAGIAVPSALALAAAWQLTRPKLLCLRACHRGSPLPLRGWRASAGVGRFALRNALACVGSCWAMMLVMVVADGAQLLWMVALTAIVCAEKLSTRPLRATRRTAVALVVAALCGGLVALLG